MPANLDRNVQTGRGTFFGRTPAWHRDGFVIGDQEISMDEGMELAGHIFEVELEPIFRRLKDGSFVPVPEGQLTIRADRDSVLGVVGPHYRPIQNRDAFKVLQPLLDNGIARLRTGGTLNGGKDVWMLVEFLIDHPIVQEVFTDQIIPFGVVTNNHAGQRLLTIGETPIEIVCGNTHQIAQVRWDLGMDRNFRLRHTVNVEENLAKAAEDLFSGVVDRHVEIARQFKLLRETYLEVADYRRLVLDVLAPLPKEAPKNPWAERALERTEARRNRLLELREKADGQKGDGSAWEAMRAVAQSLDHDTHLWPTRGSRVRSMMIGHLGQLKQSVMDGLVIYSAGADIEDPAALSA